MAHSAHTPHYLTGSALPDWIRTEVKGEYAKLTALDQKEYDAKLQEMHEWLDEGLGVIVEDRHKSGKIEGDVLKMVARYSDLARNDFYLYDVHIVGYIFSLSETAEGRSIYQLFSGTPLFDNILNKEWGANLRKAMKEMESVLIVENARKRAADNPDIAPPEPFLVEVNFERSRTDSRIQATHRRIVPLLYHAMSWMALTQRIRNGGAPVDIPLSMHWAKWADEGSKLFLAFINWPADIPVPDGSNSDPDYKYDFWAVFSSHLRIIYESWKKYKEGNLPEAEAEKLMRIVSWSDGDIALITNVNGQVLLRVRDSPTWQRAVEAEQARVAKLVAPPPPVKEKVSKPKRKGGSGLPGPSFQPAHHVPMPGYIETSSPPQELLTLPPDFHPDDQEDQESSSPKRPSPKRAKVDDKSKGKKKKKN
ncbi:hypothetical protein ONZ45_g17271 [Pleurotus djamor]|nr:hypothetical protein ONZ45_g17271 [Pleurotus djamor]